MSDMSPPRSGDDRVNSAATAAGNYRFAILVCLLLSLFTFSLAGFAQLGTEADPALLEALAAHWSALVSGDVSGALRFVEANSQNSFLQQRPLGLLGWRIEQVSVESVDRVSISMTGSVIDQAENAPWVAQWTDIWVRTPEGWRREIPSASPKELNALLYGDGQGKNESLADEVQVLPAILEMQFLNEPQQGRFHLLNGTAERQELKEVLFDRDLFTLVEPLPKTIRPGEKVFIELRYTGVQERKDQTSVIKFRFEGERGPREFERQILYNHVGPTTRRFFGLTESDVRDLKRDAVPDPVLKPPRQ